MATYTSTGRSAHHTLAANTVDVVILNQFYSGIEIINDDSSNGIYVLVDEPNGSGGVTSTSPTVAGDGTFYIGPGAVRVLGDLPDGANTTVRLISAGACSYHVTGV